MSVTQNHFITPTWRCPQQNSSHLVLGWGEEEPRLKEVPVDKLKGIAFCTWNENE